MVESILGLLHNMKTFSHYKDEPFKLQKQEKEMLINFLEQKDVQKCIPKVPKQNAAKDLYYCPNCGYDFDTNLINTIMKNLENRCPSCGQRIKWGESNNEKVNSKGSSIFSNFGVNIDIK